MKSQVNWFDHLFNVISVIIGVSLAFWVNDSAARNKKESDLNSLVKSFMDELESDSITYVNYQIPSNLEQISAIEKVLGFLATEDYDSLEVYFESAIGLNNYHPTATTFNSLASSGKLDLIEDFSLKQAINAYHTVAVKEAEWRGKFQVDFYINELLPWLMYHMDLQEPHFDEVDKTQLSNLLLVYSGIIANKIDQYKYISVRSGELKVQLGSEIN